MLNFLIDIKYLEKNVDISEEGFSVNILLVIVWLYLLFHNIRGEGTIMTRKKYIRNKQTRKRIRERRQKQKTKYIDNIVGVCGILEFIINRIKELQMKNVIPVINVIIKNSKLISIILLYIIILRVIIIMIPNFKMNKNNISKEEAKSSSFLVGFVVCLFTILVLHELNIGINNIITYAKNNIVMEKQENQEYGNVKNGEVITEEQIIIDNYIRRCSEEIISIKELELLNNNELDCIYNEIYQDGVSLNNLNYYQRKNIENIVNVKEEKYN